MIFSVPISLIDINIRLKTKSFSNDRNPNDKGIGSIFPYFAGVLVNVAGETHTSKIRFSRKHLANKWWFYMVLFGPFYQ